jgi:hypothetical protein
MRAKRAVVHVSRRVPRRRRWVCLGARARDKPLNFWYGLKARDLVLIRNYKVTHFAYVCAYDGVVLLPVRLVMKHIDEENLTKTPSEGPLIHYHMKFRYENDDLIWIISSLFKENVNTYFIRSKKES